MADLTLRPADHAPVPEKGALAVELVDRDTDAARSLIRRAAAWVATSAERVDA